MRILKIFGHVARRGIDRVYVASDKWLLRRTRNLRLVPHCGHRRGGKVSYGEWCHVIGIFQTLLYMHLDRERGNRILDIGCGTGILGIASEPYVQDEGKYIGIDVRKADIDFCNKHYREDHFLFQHLDVANPTYAAQQPGERRRWDIDDVSIDLMTALSVWTHLNEEDAVYYFREIDRVLKPGAKAIVTFFLLDHEYYEGREERSDRSGRYHSTRQDLWIFEVPCSASGEWFHPRWARQAEDAIGVTPTGVNRMLEGTGLELRETFAGNWKERPGIFFQDVLVFEKGRKQEEGKEEEYAC
jgi:SAM-dependent methyltransferase